MSRKTSDVPLEQIDDYRWRIPRSYHSGMRVPGLIFADEKLLQGIRKDRALEQVANVAHLPGIVRYSLAMPDIHWGYGFAIGGVAATDPDEGGVITPGGIGFDINCGVRLVRTHLEEKDVRPRLKSLIATLFNEVPTGLGVRGDIQIKGEREMDKVLSGGARWALEQGFAEPEDLEYTEAGGCLEGARPEKVSERARERGRRQLGTLGSGNHFLEVQKVETVFLKEEAHQMGLTENQVCVMIHSGSRGLGYQVCEDSLRVMERALEKYKIQVPDRQLCAAPIRSPEGQDYIGAMQAAANYAWCNRQCLLYRAREVLQRFFGMGPKDLGMDLIYDVAHNIAKFERYEVKGKIKELCVHRKGATRAFGPDHPELPDRYRRIGQPVIIPGDMGRASYVLVGTGQAMTETFGTSCHGAGRQMSRKAAIRASKGRNIARELEDGGVVAMARDRFGLAEEQPDAYKDVNDVVSVVEKAGIARAVCRLKPLGVIKG